MRIALVTLAPTEGGVSRHMRDLAIGIRERGHSVVLGVPRSLHRLRGWAAGDGLEVVDPAASVHDPADAWHLHLHNTLDRRALPLVLARRARRPRGLLAITEHLPRVPRTDARLTDDPALGAPRPTPGAPLMKRVFKGAQYRAAHVVLSPGASAASFVAERWGRSTARCIANGVAPREPLPPPSGDGPLRVACVGALGWQKGFDLLLAAGPRLRERIDVSFVGEGPAREALEARAERLRETSRLGVRFTGWADDVEPFVAAAHVVAMPSRWEALPYAALDAFAAGRAVVGTDVDGLDELVEDGVTGRRVAAEDPAALAEALDALARDREACVRMGQNAWTRVRERYRLDRMLDEHLRLYGGGS